MGMDYSSTVLLPKTDFPMRADLPKREPAMAAEWLRDGTYEALLKARQGSPEFHLHDGPPFANGDAHVGHALNMVLKDIVLKSRAMMGFRTPFVPGWDCHGLPIEHKVVTEQKLVEMLGLKTGGKGRETAPAQVRDAMTKSLRKFMSVSRLGCGHWPPLVASVGLPG